jgi:hypothetical protein
MKPALNRNKQYVLKRMHFHNVAFQAVVEPASNRQTKVNAVDPHVTLQNFVYPWPLTKV